MRFGGLKRLTRTLRFRLMVWNTSVVLLMVIPTLFLVREGLVRVTVHEFDERLREDTLEIKLAIRQAYPRLQQLHGELQRKAVGHAHHGWFVQLLEPDGSALWASQNLPDLDVPLTPADGTTLIDVGSYRLAQDVVRQPGVPPLIVRVGSSFQSVEEDIALLSRMMLLAGAAILLLAPLGGYWLSRRAIRPLAHIIHKTGQLRPTNLAERLRLRRTGDELDQLSQTINGLLDRLAAYVAEKRDFLTNVAHELRSPLAAIRSSVEVALNGERTTEEYTGLLADIMEECGSLGTLVNQLLLLAEGDAGRAALSGQEARLDRVVERSVAMFQGAAEAHGVELHAAALTEALVPGDDYHLRQIVNNLLDNAIKFTPAGGRVAVELAGDAGRHRAVLTVSDTGAGIPDEDLPRIFERFYCGDRARHREGARRSSGLGLSICASIVDTLGGTIDVQSTTGQGSRFTVALPLRGAVSAAEKPTGDHAWA